MYKKGILVKKLLWVLCGKKRSMQRSGYASAERTQCVLWVPRGYRATDVLSLFQDSYGWSPQLDSLYENGEMTTKQEDRIIIEVEIDDQELVVHYEIRYENYSSKILEYQSVQQQHKLLCRIKQYGTS